MKIKEILWCAVQPTPYNNILYNAFKQSKRFCFKIAFSLKIFDSNPYKEKYYDDGDYFFNEPLGIDFHIIRKSFSANTFFVFVGWNNKTKLFASLIRSAFGLPFAIWTDSVKPENYTSKNIGFYTKKYLCNKATIIFTTGEFGIQKMIESKLVSNTKKVVSLPFFVDLPKALPEKDFDQPAFNVLQLCRLIDGKGAEISIEAFAILKREGYTNIKLSIGGIGPNESKYKQLVQQHHVEDQVKLTGWINATQLADLRKEAFILIHPVTKHDPFPLVVLESLANGIPVIGSSLAGSVVERVKDGENGFIISPDSPQVLADKIKAIYNDRTLLKGMSVNARKSAEEWPVEKGLKIVEDALEKFLLK